MVYPDTSFLCALYIPQSTSTRAIAHVRRLTDPLESTSLLFFEFRQSLQFQVFRHSKDRNQGYALTAAQAASAALHLGVTGFLTFDENQKKLAEAEGLVVPV